MKVAIIGAGVSGLLSLKYVLENGIQCDCFEETDTFGGTWVYSPETGTNRYGHPIYRPMYQNLTTTIPKELMSFRDFPYGQHINYSYLTSKDVLNYLTNYVKQFDLEKHILYHTVVIKVEPTKNDKWVVTSKNLVTKKSYCKFYNYVFVCSGHYRTPHIPVIPDQHLYQGLEIHSRDYRSPKMCENKQVLIIGAGLSGFDIANQIVRFARSVHLSHWIQKESFIEGVVDKPSVSRFEKNCAVFSDGSKEDIDVVIYSTGYEYKFPFLAENCGITTTSNWVQPLYKHIVNIQHPTMVFIGIPYLTTVFVINELQVQFALALINKVFTLPSQQEMLSELQEYVSNIKHSTGSIKYLHKLGFLQREYTSELAKMAKLKPVRPVLNNLTEYILTNKQRLSKKQSTFKILDDYTFLERTN